MTLHIPLWLLWVLPVIIGLALMVWEGNTYHSDYQALPNAPGCIGVLILFATFFAGIGFAVARCAR